MEYKSAPLLLRAVLDACDPDAPGGLHPCVPPRPGARSHGPWRSWNRRQCLIADQSTIDAIVARYVADLDEEDDVAPTVQEHVEEALGFFQMLPWMVECVDCRWISRDAKRDVCPLCGGAVRKARRLGCTECGTVHVRPRGWTPTDPQVCRRCGGTLTESVSDDAASDLMPVTDWPIARERWYRSDGTRRRKGGLRPTVYREEDDTPPDDCGGWYSLPKPRLACVDCGTPNVRPEGWAAGDDTVCRECGGELTDDIPHDTDMEPMGDDDLPVPRASWFLPDGVKRNRPAETWDDPPPPAEVPAPGPPPKQIKIAESPVPVGAKRLLHDLALTAAILHASDKLAESVTEGGVRDEIGRLAATHARIREAVMTDDVKAAAAFSRFGKLSPTRSAAIRLIAAAWYEAECGRRGVAAWDDMGWLCAEGWDADARAVEKRASALARCVAGAASPAEARELATDMDAAFADALAAIPDSERRRGVHLTGSTVANRRLVWDCLEIWREIKGRRTGSPLLNPKFGKFVDCVRMAAVGLEQLDGALDDNRWGVEALKSPRRFLREALEDYDTKWKWEAVLVGDPLANERFLTYLDERASPPPPLPPGKADRG